VTLQRDLAGELLALAAGRPACDVELDEAWATVIPRSNAVGLTLGELLGRDNADDWTEWALQKPPTYWPLEFERALAIVAAAYFPDLWASLASRRRAA
jgi:hypothetical protein